MESVEREARLLKLAEAIADGTPIDWELAAQADPENSDSFDGFRAVESVVSAHGPVPDAGDGAVVRSWGPLQVLAKIGEGAFGEVYRAFEPGLDREVALKLLQVDRAQDERSTRKFVEEARRLAKAKHPNVLVVHGADVHDGRAGMWTDLVRGKTLEEILSKEGPMSAREAAFIGIDLCRALAAVHASGMIHRDVKTHNVMREEGGRIVLMDFGSVGVFSPDGPPNPEEGGYGTPLTVAPELLRGGKPRPSSDIYSLGVLLYRLVSRRYPIEAASIPELLEKHARSVRIPLREARPDLPTDFVQIVERALDPDPAKRFAGAGSMERALAAGFVTAAGEGSSDGRRAYEKPRRRLWPYAVAAAGVAAVAIVVLLPGLKTALRPGTSSEAVPDPTATASRPALAANARLYREKDGKSEPLMHGGRIAPGDALYMELEGNEPMNVYVLDEDSAGRVYVLFPLPGLDAANPLAPKEMHRLPGTRGGIRENWEVTSAGGSEDVSVIASREPLKEVEIELASMPLAQPGAAVQYKELTGKALKETVNIITRGIGGTTAAAPTPGANTAKLSGILADLAQQPDRARDIWVWQTRLNNPQQSP